MKKLIFAFLLFLGACSSPDVRIRPNDTFSNSPWNQPVEVVDDCAGN